MKRKGKKNVSDSRFYSPFVFQDVEKKIDYRFNKRKGKNNTNNKKGMTIIKINNANKGKNGINEEKSKKEQLNIPNILNNDNNKELPRKTKNELNNNIRIDHVEVNDTFLLAALEKAGVSSSEKKDFASYLIAAYKCRIPLLLAGPSGEQIATAFSASVCGSLPMVLNCNADYNENTLKNIIESESEVIIVKYPFAIKWRDTLAELLSEGEKFYILINPFYEDLQIEPMSFYNSVMPFITEIIIDKPPIFETLELNKIELPEQTSKDNSLHIALLKDMKFTPYCINQIQTLLSEMHYLLGNDSKQTDYKYVLFPYAYVTNQGEVIAQKWHQIDKDAKSFISKYFNISIE